MMKTTNILMLFSFSLSLYAACPDGKTYPVTLTFDDGPHEKLTPIVLDVLKAEKVPATFFVLGKHFEGGKAKKENAPKYDLLDRMRREGHIIGSHTFSHISHPALSDKEIVENLTRSQSVIGEYLAPIVRLPFGAGALRGKTPEARKRNEQVMAIVKDTGYKHVLWDIDTRDWDAASRRELKEKMLKDICSEKGGIILFHDIHEFTALNIKSLIRAIKAEGHPLVGMEDSGRNRKKRELIMRIKLFILSLTLILSLNAIADSVEFTCLQSSGSNVFAGVRKLEKGVEPETYMLQVDSTKMTSDKISLPNELSGRELRAVIGTKGPEILVLTQWTQEQGDKPQLHSYHPETKQWKKITEIDCPSFSSLKGDSSQIVVNCLVADKKGKEVVNPVKIKITEVKMEKKLDIQIPQRKIAKKNLQAELMGESFEWKQLKVVYKKIEKVFTP